MMSPKIILLLLCLFVHCHAFMMEQAIKQRRVSQIRLRTTDVLPPISSITRQVSYSVPKGRIGISMSRGVADGASNRRSRSWVPVLERTHERLVAIVFASLGGSILYLAGISGRTAGLPPVEPSAWLIVAETTLSLTWSSMILAISFLEAWTKFRAPFLKKYIAVDVGRHVFATLNAAELGISSSFWLHRLFQCYQVQKLLGGDLFYKSRSYYRHFTFTLPAIATCSLLLQVLIISPKLYLRAKSKIVEGFDNALPSVKISMTKAEQIALTNVAQDVRRVKRLPSRMWHSLYALIEIVKIGCLNAFVLLSWMKLLASVATPPKPF